MVFVSFDIFVQDCRCRSLADKVIPSTSPVLLCQTCAMRRNPGNPWPRGKCCVVCSSFCNTPRTVEARACMKHTRWRGKDAVQCATCSFAVSLHSKSSVSAQLCLHCSFGNDAVRCAMIDVR